MRMAIAAAAAAVLLSQPTEDEDHGPLADVTALIAVVSPTNGNTCTGEVRFIENNGSIRIIADVRGLTPGSKHGFHIHEFGDLRSPDGSSAGGHYNPEGHDHALPHMGERHAGDLGNLEADSNGRATLQLVTRGLTLCGDHNPVIGRSIVIHANEDDGSQPTGNAGPRIGVGVIGVSGG